MAASLVVPEPVLHVYVPASSEKVHQILYSLEISSHCWPIF